MKIILQEHWPCSSGWNPFPRVVFFFLFASFSNLTWMNNYHISEIRCFLSCQGKSYCSLKNTYIVYKCIWKLRKYLNILQVSKQNRNARYRDLSICCAVSTNFHHISPSTLNSLHYNQHPHNTSLKEIYLEQPWIFLSYHVECFNFDFLKG